MSAQIAIGNGAGIIVLRDIGNALENAVQIEVEPGAEEVPDAVIHRFGGGV